MRESKFVVLFTMNKKSVMDLREQITSVIEKGGKVYGVGSPVTEELKKMGILLDKKLYEYYDAGGLDNIKNMVLYVINKEDNPDIKIEDIKPIPFFAIYDL
jgi:hypothetical protein